MRSQECEDSDSNSTQSLRALRRMLTILKMKLMMNSPSATLVCHILFSIFLPISSNQLPCAKNGDAVHFLSYSRQVTHVKRLHFIGEAPGSLMANFNDVETSSLQLFLIFFPAHLASHVWRVSYSNSISTLPRKTNMTTGDPRWPLSSTWMAMRLIQ